MKRVGYLYPVVCDRTTIKAAMRLASRGKRKHETIAKILENEDFYVEELHEMLVNKTYVPSPLKTATICEGASRKKRDISKPKFYPDQIVQWCIYLSIKQMYNKSFYEYSCGSIEGRGIHKGKKYIEKVLYGDKKNTKYYLKMDVRHFYPTIKVDILIDMLRKKIKDEDFINLVKVALSQSDNLLIGMLLSQVFANVYMSGIDYWIKQTKRVDYYIRYMDDMVIFGANKRKLHKLRVEIAEELKNIGLEMKGNWQVCRLDKEPLDFMGFRFFRNKTIIRKSIMLRISRRVNKVWKKVKPTANDAFAVISYMGWIKCTDTNGFFEKWLKPKIDFNRLKNIIRSYTRNETICIRKQCAPGGVGQDILCGGGLPQYQCAGYSCDRGTARNVLLQCDRVHE